MTRLLRLGLSLAAAAPILLGSAACVSTDDIDGLHRQMNDIEKQIQALEKKSSSKEEVAKLNENVAQQTTQLLKSNADLGVRLGELATQIEQLQAKLEDTNRRLSQLSQQTFANLGNLTFHNYIDNTVASLGVMSKSYQQASTNTDAVRQNIDQRRESVHGVNLEQEMIDLLRFQRGFEASSKVMQVMDEVLDTLINRII